ncbi:potassium channel family protein [Streptomyces sp. NBC_01210]|uniref:potassium channel family protein n=1 Tax=Streptomyces sp. NBC_01210 TaxID=2903774 RepID=UPI002E14B45A|nr:potassium channel family protein [Streptomyces sp. NBC_01210]
MKDETQSTKTRRLSVLQSLWSGTRSGDHVDADAARTVVMPVLSVVPPLQQVLRRLTMALGVLLATVAIVYVDRDGYHDNANNSVDLLDAFYYATVTLSTTGYGDIVPHSDSARLTNILLITPLRVLFLIILVGTTLEVLTERTRQQARVHRWKGRTQDHVVVVGYGTKGRHAIATLLGQGTPKDKIVIIDPQRKAVDAASSDGFVAIHGDATRSETLLQAELPRAAQVIIAPQRDDTATLVTLTARQLNRRAAIVAAVREDENVPLIKQSGADAVVTSSSSAGRLLGLSTGKPYVGTVLEELMTYGSGLDLSERPVTNEETGRSPRECKDLVVAVVRRNEILGYDQPDAATLRPGDRLITVTRTKWNR